MTVIDTFRNKIDVIIVAYNRKGAVFESLPLMLGCDLFARDIEGY